MASASVAFSEDKNTKQCWEVHKFGGTSVADAECFLRVASIVEGRLGVSFGQTSDDIETDRRAVHRGVDDEETSTNVGWSDDPGDGVRSIAVVVSAMGGKPKVTDLLLNAVKAASERDASRVETLLQQVVDKHARCVEALPLDVEVTESSFEGKDYVKNVDSRLELMKQIRSDISDVRDILKTVSLMKWRAERISELVSGYGELWSARILSSLLNARSRVFQEKAKLESQTSLDARYDYSHRHQFVYMDARRFITIDEEAIQNGVVCWELSEERLREAYSTEVSKSADPGCTHLIVTGYVASNTEGIATTLQRDGSDYSAAILGRLLRASEISIWTDVDGVLSADPRRVPHAHVIPEVSYNEAMELAYFGAKVVHPKTMQPAISAKPRKIPIYIRNTFNASFPGTRIYTNSTTTTSRDQCVCGFSSIEDMALIDVEGTGLVGVPGIARRLFGTLEAVGVSVVLISQASSEHTITFATTTNHVDMAKNAIEEEFQRELAASRITAIEVVSPCSIIAAVGDGMSATAGVSGRFFSALGDAKINVLAISQGSSERNISAVVRKSESTRALRAVHAAFRLSHSVVRVGVVGLNDIGSSLLELLEVQRAKLRESFDIDIQVCAVAADAMSQDVVVLMADGERDADSITRASLSRVIDSVSHESILPDGTHANMNRCRNLPGGVGAIAQHIQSDDVPHAVIIDCTADEEVGKMHPEWLSEGVHVITANNSALSGPPELRDAIHSAETQRGKLSARYLREVTVGGGLPVISTLQNLLHSGDKIRRIDGIFSVSMSYIMHRIAPPPNSLDCSKFDEKVTDGIYHSKLSISPEVKMEEPCSFSEAMQEAISLGLTELDPAKDLSFEYTARCLMVLAKELGFDDDCDVKKILRASEPLAESGAKFEDVISAVDAQMRHRVLNANKKGCVPRQISSIDVKTGSMCISIVDVPNTHIFAVTPPSNECVRFFTARHRRYPLVVEGPSAGADSTSSALLAELLNLMRSRVGPRSGTLSRTASSAALS